MTFKELCEARYSCRAYKHEAVPQDKLDYVLSCARLAPSACNRQPWRLRYVTSASGLAAIRECYNREWLTSAPAVIVVSAVKSEAWTRSSDGKCHSDVDAAIVTEHICLAAAEQGLATCWVCNFDAPRCHAALGLADDEEPVVLLPIGFPADGVAPKKRKDVTEFVTEA